ncbi:MAG: phosphoribosylformylglycinamidine synthase subunit PurQ [Deltaproteobacteria bacterium]|nr:phosphoribosylformylglycinamidine synthase subunit PurQ [Deltaproteobacteria bacterium]
MRFAVKSVLGAPAELVWHKSAELPTDTAAVLLPGGFSYGDYLRCGAMARFSPVMAAVKRFADAGGPVFGTCNGFQILCEAGLLPGALLRNRDLHFVCEVSPLRVERDDTIFTSRTRAGETLHIPIKHGEGAWFATPELLARVEERGQVVLRYLENPNGAVADVAGITNERGNVFGLMPHPEHAVEPAFGGTDGAKILGSLVDHVLGSGA